MVDERKERKREGKRTGINLVRAVGTGTTRESSIHRPAIIAAEAFYGPHGPLTIYDICATCFINFTGL